MTLLLCIFLILPLIVFLSSVTDVYSYTIPNEFSIILIAAFFLFAFINPAFDWTLIAKHVGSGFIILILGFICFCGNTLGGGDVKILTASSLWIGLHDLSVYVFFVTLVGGALSLFLYLWRKTPSLKIYHKFKLLKSLYFGYYEGEEITTPRSSIPYAIAIFVGLCLTLPHSFIVATVFK